MLRIGVFGATGYTGYELIRLLSGHAQADLVFATSRSNAGRRLSDLYPCPCDVSLTDPESVWVDGLGGVDVVFLCLPHGESMPTVKRVYDAGVRAIDLSADLRLRDAAVYERWYRTQHSAPTLLGEAVYGLPEVYRERISGAALVGNPGCYPTSVLLALHPLVRGGHLSDSRIIVDSKSGVSGAGRKLSVPYLFCEVSEDFRPYNIGHAHRHISEMEQELAAWGDRDVRVTFSPHLLPVARGIVSTIYVTLETGWSVPRLVDLYHEAYRDEPFVHVLPAGKLASLAYVVRTNRCAISFAEAGEGDFIVVSAIDNLVKGASGQAIQNMNVMFGLDETMGLPM